MSAMEHTAFVPRIELNPEAKSVEDRAAILANPGFGNHFTDHMFVAEWTVDNGWQDPRLVPYGPFSIDPGTSVLHYGQEIFEGLKAYAHADGSVWLFRPESNGQRLNRSARRLALPELPVEDFLTAVKTIIDVDRDWVPTGGESSLYLRPFMFASESFLGVRASQHVTFSVIASPAGAYFAGGVRPVDIWLSTEYSRAGVGGTGAAKCGGNYAASLLPQQEAADNGCAQVAFLDSVEHRWIEELGGMNLFFVYADGSIVTPELSGSILEGITRDSILTLAREKGINITERRISIDEWREGAASGEIAEVFACGTAAVVTPVGRLKWSGGEVTMGTGESGPVTLAIREALVDVQYGRAEDTHGWMTRVL